MNINKFFKGTIDYVKKKLILNLAGYTYFYIVFIINSQKYFCYERNPSTTQSLHRKGESK